MKKMHCFNQVIIIVADVSSRDTGIAFTGAPYIFYTVEGAPVNSSVGKINAFDYKESTNLTFSIVPDADSSMYYLHIV